MSASRFVTLSTAASLMSLLACSSATAPAPMAEGVWGGQEASLVLTREGGSLSYPCGVGTMDPTWAVDANGQLTGNGQHFLGGGPVPVGGRPPHPARYVGTISGNTLLLTVTLTDLNETIGPFHLQRGGPFVAESCL